METTEVIEIHENSHEENESKDGVEHEANSCPPQESNQVSYWNGLYVLVIVATCVLQTSCYTLIPRHNSIVYPSYWYEIIIAVSFGMHVQGTISTIMKCYIFFKLKSLISINLTLKLFFKLVAGFVVPYCFCYILWSVYFGYNHPMPFNVMGCCLINWACLFVGVWQLFPTELRAEVEFRRRLKYFLLYCSWLMVIDYQNQGLSTLFGVLPSNLQWTMAIIIPSFRSMNLWILTKISRNIKEDDNAMADICTHIIVLSIYGFFVAIMLASANATTVYSIIGVEMFLNLISCYQIIKLQRKVMVEEDEEMSRKNEKEMVSLALSETIEIVCALAYAIGFATAYYGPNAFLIGNVRSNYFDSTEVEDVEHLFMVLLELFTVDVCCMIITVIALRSFGNINFWAELCKFIKNYWIIMAIEMPTYVSQFFAWNDVNAAMDFSMQFMWLTDEGRLRLIYNATDFDDSQKALLLQNTTFT